MSIYSIRIDGAKVSANGCHYICDFDIFFEQDDKRNEMLESFGLQDIGEVPNTVVFLFVGLHRAFNDTNGTDGLAEPIDSRLNLEDAIISFCDTDPTIHMHALKQIKEEE